MTMDPDEILCQIRAMRAAQDATNETEKTARLVEAYQLFERLDAWISSGGIPPKDWDVRHPRYGDPDYRTDQGLSRTLDSLSSVLRLGPPKD